MELARPLAAVTSERPCRLVVTEDEFYLIYQRTARPLRAYLYRMSGDLSRTDDLLQETYLRFLGARLPAEMTEEHQKNYLFRIATNLLHDDDAARKRAAVRDDLCSARVAHDIPERYDWARCMEQLTRRQRALLWLAYVEGFTHKEIGRIIGVKAPSVRPMLARARDRLGEILRTAGFGGT